MSTAIPIIEWNRKRNSLEFNPKLEIKMLSEEAREFYMAENRAERLREYVDFLFVWEGTKAKYFAQQYVSVMDITLGHDQWKSLQTWANAAMREMWNIVNTEGTDGWKVKKALSIITEANQAKSAEKVGGKVIKGAAYADPIIRIKELFGE